MLPATRYHVIADCSSAAFLSCTLQLRKLLHIPTTYTFSPACKHQASHRHQQDPACKVKHALHGSLSSLKVPQVAGITVLDDGATADNQASDSDGSVSDSDSPAVTDSTLHGVPQPRELSGNRNLVPAQQRDQQAAELQDFQDVQERREEMKQQMGVTASKLLQNPEANLPSMRSLLTLAADKDSQVTNLFTCLVSCCTWPDLLCSTSEG